MKYAGTWWLPGGARRIEGIFSLDDEMSGGLQLLPDAFHGLRMKGREDIGEGIDHETLGVVHGEADGRKVTLQGVTRSTPGNYVPSTWAVLRAWEGAHLPEPQRAMVVRARIAASSLAHWVAQGLPAGQDTMTLVLPGGGTLTVPQQKDWGWILLEYNRPRHLEQVEHDAFKLASLESVLSNSPIALPEVEAHLEDGSIVQNLMHKPNLVKPLLATSDFANGVDGAIARFAELWDAMPLVLDRLHEAQEPQTALARALLVTSCLEPLFDHLYEATDADAVAYARRKRRVLRWIFRRADRAWVASRLGSGLSYHEKVKRLLAPLRADLGWSEQERDVWANNLHGLRVELAHNPVPLYRSNTRWMESTRLCNLGQVTVLYHLWVALGATPQAAAKAGAEHWRGWVTWTLPSVADEPLGDRRRMRRRRR